VAFLILRVVGLITSVEKRGGEKEFFCTGHSAKHPRGGEPGKKKSENIVKDKFRNFFT